MRSGSLFFHSIRNGSSFLFHVFRGCLLFSPSPIKTNFIEMMKLDDGHGCLFFLRVRASRMSTKMNDDGAWRKILKTIIIVIIVVDECNWDWVFWLNYCILFFSLLFFQIKYRTIKQFSNIHVYCKKIYIY